MLTKIPCKNCITFPICRSQVHENIEEQMPPLKIVYHKCKLIQKYLRLTGNTIKRDLMVVNYIYGEDKIDYSNDFLYGWILKDE